MDLDLITRVAALIAVLGTAVVYGTDVFCAIVLRPALAMVDDSVLVAVTGRVHRYGDRRMPLPGVLGVIATATSAVLAMVAANWVQAIAAAAALVLLLIWLLLYTRVSAPINRQLTAAAEAGQPLPNGRALQTKWDSIIGARAVPARSGTGRPVRGADGLTGPCHGSTPADIKLKGARYSMFQLRIYTLRSPEALQQYASVHWARHLCTFTTFGVTTHGVWTERGEDVESTRRADRLPAGRRHRSTHAADHGQPRLRRRHGRLRRRRDRRRSVATA